jgi:hypothetical protein
MNHLVDECPASWADIVRFQDPVRVPDVDEMPVEEEQEADAIAEQDQVHHVAQQEVQQVDQQEVHQEPQQEVQQEEQQEVVQQEAQGTTVPPVELPVLREPPAEPLAGPSAEPPAETPVQIAIDPQSYMPERDAQSPSQVFMQSEESGDERSLQGGEELEDGEIGMEEELREEALRIESLKRSSPPMVDSYSKVAKRKKKKKARS